MAFYYNKIKLIQIKIIVLMGILKQNDLLSLSNRKNKIYYTYLCNFIHLKLT